MAKLICKICGNERDLPKCCDKSMVLGQDFILNCCESPMCEHQKIPECCGQLMEYRDF